MVVPENKWQIVEETRALAKDYEQQYNDGLITQGEKYNKVVDAWAKCSDKVAEEIRGDGRPHRRPPREGLLAGRAAASTCCSRSSSCPSAT